MTPASFQLPAAFDYGATLAWGIGGALLAARKGYDVVGVFVVALVTATGGGVIRDGIFLQQGPPVLVRQPVYLLLVVFAVAVALGAGHFVHKNRNLGRLFNVADAYGLGAYAVVGAQMAFNAGLGILPALLIGVVNAVGGGLLRDIIMRRPPEILSPGALIALAALASATCFALLVRLAGLAPSAAGMIAVGLGLSIRFLSLHFGIRTTSFRALMDPEEEPRVP